MSELLVLHVSPYIAEDRDTLWRYPLLLYMMVYRPPWVRLLSRHRNLGV